MCPGLLQLKQSLVRCVEGCLANVDLISCNVCAMSSNVVLSSRLVVFSVVVAGSAAGVAAVTAAILLWSGSGSGT